MGRRLQTRGGPSEGRVVARLTASYLAVFAIVIAALSVLAFVLVDRNYRDVLDPVLATPEGRSVFARFEGQAIAAILALDGVLLIVVGLSSYALARAAVRPLLDARRREERFAADAAHELRTPLSVIASVAQAARDGDRHDASLATIARQALEAGQLVGDLLTLARNVDARSLAREPVDLGALANKAFGEVRATRAGIAFDGDFGSAIVDGDERRLLQLARNLFENASRHARTRVVARVEAVGGDAQIVVEDDGPGVAPELEGRLFERFSKGMDSPGSGLGLAICRWVARSHGGEIAHDGGSRFIARLPLAKFEAG